MIGRWTGHNVQAELLKLLETPLGMDIEAAAAEFEEGMVRFVEIARRQERRALLARLQSDPSTENLRELVAKTRKN